MIGRDEARQIIEEVIKGVSKWKSIAIGLGIGKREIDMFEQVYNKSIDNIDSSDVQFIK